MKDCVDLGVLVLSQGAATVLHQLFLVQGNKIADSVLLDSKRKK